MRQARETHDATKVPPETPPLERKRAAPKEPPPYNKSGRSAYQEVSTVPWYFSSMNALISGLW